MEEILARGKEFEHLVNTFDKIYPDLVIGIEIVKKFIIEKDLILYGGSAIDYALRLKGDKIYPDDLLPDLDFYSPDNVEHSYQLADLLFHKGYKEARAISGMHVITMRVDIAANHFIADITYIPRDIFGKLPFLKFNGMKVIHPLFQRIDIHSSLSFPYDDVPQEVVFARWGKDIKRFNKLAEHYPVEVGKSAQVNRIRCPLPVKKYVFGGFLGYALLYNYFQEKFPAPMSGVIPAHFEIDGGEIVFDGLEDVELIHFDISKAANDLKLSAPRYFEPLINLTPARVIGAAGDNTYTVFSTKNKLLSANSHKIGDSVFRIANVQYLLKQFLCGYFVADNKLAAVYLSRYQSIMCMINHYENELSKESPKSASELARQSLLFPTVSTYGHGNVNLAREVALNRLHHELTGEELLIVPRNYYPEKSIRMNVPHPTFDPTTSKLFTEQGREIL